MTRTRAEHARYRFCAVAGALTWLSLSVACGNSDGGSADTAATNGVAATSSGPGTTTTAGDGSATGSGGTASTTTTTGATGSGAGGAGSGVGGASTAGSTTMGSGGAPSGSGGSGTGGTTTTGGVADTVSRSSASFTFDHFPIEVGSDHVWNGATTPAATPTSTTYDTVVLENGYLTVTLLPDYGGRILSILHKPTGRELLYQNPLGTPYLMNEDIFYYNYLVIMGGIFPSFPEPEHGKYWNQPYAFEVVSESAEAITVRMSRQDDLDLAAGVPAAYTTGRTDVLVELEVTLRAGSSAVELDTKLTNTRDTAVPEFEYWTVTTLAPGSTPGDTKIGLNTRILAEMAQVHLLESSWAWFGSAEERVSGEVFSWNNLSHFENWVDQGTAFANPSYQANWSGLLNEDAAMGILRVSANAQTPGLKLWTFGTQSLSIDINDGANWLRPTIEMWHGITPEFWDRATLAANEVREWSDRYFPTLGLQEVTAASEYGALFLSSVNGATETTLSVDATLTLPEQTVRAILSLDGALVSEQDVVVLAGETTQVTAPVSSDIVNVGTVFEAEFRLGDQSLLSGQVTLQ